MKLFSTSDTAPRGSQQVSCSAANSAGNRQLASCETQLAPAPPSIPTSAVGKVNPKDAEIPPHADSCVGQNPPKASNALPIPTQTSLT